MEEKNRLKRGTLESFFASASAKKQKAHSQLTSVGDDGLQRPSCDDVLPPSTPETPTLSAISGDDPAQQPESSAMPSAASEACSIPVDISRCGDERPVQPVLSVYPRNTQSRCFQPQWYSKFTWLEYSNEQDRAYCFCCRHFSAGNLNVRVRIYLLDIPVFLFVSCLNEK